jgi:outer membrane receptor protein involved in Fe transport
MQKSGFRHRLLASSMICGASMMVAATASSAFAQDTAPATDKVQEVVVTGSRIPSPNLTSASPVTTVSSAEIKLEGVTRIEDLLNNLPQVFAGQGSAISNGSNGTATVDLRGLGANRTLVLIDGKRVVPGDPGSPAVDLNFIPAQLIDRIDLDTGGASAVYGSDAVAGVVNFHMKKNFTGIQIDAQGSMYEHGNDNTYLQNIVASHNYPYPKGDITDGYTTSVSVIMGVNAPDDKGNITAYATYRSVQAVTEADRDYTACTLAESGPTFVCSGSGTTNPTRFTLGKGGGPAGSVPGSYQLTGSGATTSLIPYTSAGSYNFGPINYLQRPDTRYTFGAYGDYRVNPMVDVYTQMMFMDDDSVAQIAASGSFGTVVTVPCNYPYLTPAETKTFCGGSTSATQSFTGALSRRNVEGGGRQSDYRHTDYRMVIGSKGDLDKVWSYDASLQYETTVEKASAQNYFSIAKVENALSNCTLSPGNGCLPYDAFQIGGVTQAQLNYLYTAGYTGGQATEQVANLTFTGKLGEYGLKSPWAADGMGVALGTEYRRENITQYDDSETSSGDLEGAGGASQPVNGTFDVYELFAEARGPIVQDKPFAKSISVDAAFRYSDYSTAGTTETYAIMPEWSINRDVTFRGSFQRAVRAPNVIELFSPQLVGLATYVDNCAVNTPGATPLASLAQCERTGMTAAQYGNVVNLGTSSQNNQLTGGNPSLKPEIADSYTGGVVVKPSMVPGLNFSVDYFNIFIANVIQAGLTSDQQVLNNCLATGSSTYCSLIHRDSSGSLQNTANGYILAGNVNAGSLQTSGIDLNGSYRMPLSKIGLDHLGSVNFNFVGTYLLSYTQEAVPGTGAQYDCAGYFGNTCGTPNPIWRHSLRTTWNTPWHGLQISANWRYYDSVKVDLLSPNPVLNGTVTGFAQPEKHLPNENYFDLAANIKIFDKYTFRAGVNNVFDQAPPVVGANECPAGPCNGNVFGQVYDALGRYIFVGVTAAY